MAVSTLKTQQKLSRIIPSISQSLYFSSSQCKTRPSPASQLPPNPKRIPFTATNHGVTRQDPYHWMKNTKDPDFVNYLKQENCYAQSFMANTITLQTKLLSDMKTRMPASISTPPELWGNDWLYYQYVPQGKEYPLLCRKLNTEVNGGAANLFNYLRGGEFGNGREEEQVLLDWNQLAQHHGRGICFYAFFVVMDKLVGYSRSNEFRLGLSLRYVHVGTCRVSPDHNFLAYTLDTTGSEQFVLHIKDLKNGCRIPTTQVHGVVSLAWAQDAHTLFYTLSDENQRPYRVMCTKVGSDTVDDVVAFTESDSSFCVDITRTKDGKFITVFVIDTTNPLGGLQRIRERVSGVQYFLEHHYGMFYILTNAPISGAHKECTEGGGYYLARCPAEDIFSADWQNVILPTEDISLLDMDIFEGHLVLSLNKKGFPMLCSIKLPINLNAEHKLEIDNLNPWFFPVPSHTCSLTPGSNHDFMSSVYRVVLASPVMPDLVVDYNMSKKTFSIVHQEEIQGSSGSFDSSSQASEYKPLDSQIGQDKKDQKVELQKWKDLSEIYCCERKEIVSHDGVLVPMTILYSRKSWKKGQSSGLLLGYGAYGEALDKSWCTDRLSLLDRGWVFAFADVRGGGGVNSCWHKSGRGFHKQNSVADFVSCGKYLVTEGFVHRDRVGAIGYSAGGLVVGAAINAYPNLFRAAVLKVPFLDICNTLLDPSLPLTILDYEEFGNPEMQSEFESILSYSPYDNIRTAACYPSVLVTASFHDSRVGVWEAAKWVAKVRDITCGDCSRSVILKTNMDGGHFGEGGRFSHCEETAYDYAFLIKVMEQQ
ncbi:hypothetical protein ACFE04_002753 [Oxalis oulophora]